MAGLIDDPNDENAVLVDHEMRLRRMERSPQIGFTSIDEGSLRVASMEGLIVEGSERVTGILIVDGTLQVTGTESVSGTLVISGAQIVNGSFTSNGTFSNTGPMSNTGTFTNSGPFNNTGKLTQTGDADLNGNTKIAGTTEISGATTLKSDLTVQGPGKVVAGNLTINPGGSYGGQIDVGGVGVLYVNAANLLVRDYLSADGLSIGALGADILGDLTVFGAKSFGMEHPSKPGRMLRHASTESPVSGVEYWGEGELDDYGELRVDLPDYFDALTKEDGRTVFVTGRGFSADWTDIDHDHFTVTGQAGGRFSWQVKAERFGGDFDVESPMPVQESNSGQ